MINIEELDARIKYEREHQAPTDLELEPITSEDEDYESAPPGYQISTYPADFTLEVLHLKWKSSEILIPDFQRGFVWKQVQASKLIESFLVGLPVPAVFFYNERSSQKFFVIDAFNTFINEANTYPAWRRILGKDTPDTRRKDMELLVRFFAMRDISAYQKPMKDFLSRFMRKNRDASPTAIKASREVFEQTCDAVVTSLGERPFHVRAGLNAAVFDGVMTAFSKHLGAIPGDIATRYKRLIADSDFQKRTHDTTTDVDTVRERLRQAERTLFG